MLTCAQSYRRHFQKLRVFARNVAEFFELPKGTAFIEGGHAAQLFDFSSRSMCKTPCKLIEAKHAPAQLLVSIVGDALLEPFWSVIPNKSNKQPSKQNTEYVSQLLLFSWRNVLNVLESGCCQNQIRPTFSDAPRHPFFETLFLTRAEMFATSLLVTSSPFSHRPEGLGVNRGFLSCYDMCYCLTEWYSTGQWWVRRWVRELTLTCVHFACMPACLLTPLVVVSY